MTHDKLLILVGGFLLLAGLLLAFIAARFGNRVMGRAGLGVAVLSPKEDSAEWLAKEGQRRCADRAFYVGLVLTSFGVILQRSERLTARCRGRPPRPFVSLRNMRSLRFSSVASSLRPFESCSTRRRAH